MVALANAWQTGAAYWPAAKRGRFANDRRNLLAVRGDLNMQKSDEWPNLAAAAQGVPL